MHKGNPTAATRRMCGTQHLTAACALAWFANRQ